MQIQQRISILQGREMSGLRSFLYAFARLLGDIKAVQKGRVGRRIGRRFAGRLTGRGLRRLFK